TVLRIQMNVTRTTTVVSPNGQKVSALVLTFAQTLETWILVNAIWYWESLCTMAFVRHFRVADTRSKGLIIQKLFMNHWQIVLPVTTAPSAFNLQSSTRM